MREVIRFLFIWWIAFYVYIVCFCDVILKMNAERIYTNVLDTRMKKESRKGMVFCSIINGRYFDDVRILWIEKKRQAGTRWGIVRIL